jgi:ABC-type nitrate/sulfonate/bicarbonate transport system substrate-binding protein
MPILSFYWNKQPIRWRTMKNYHVALVVVALLVILMGCYGLFGDFLFLFGFVPQSITIGTPALETTSLVYIAENQGYFEKNGLNVTIREYDSGSAAVPGLMRNEVDIALASEFVMVDHIPRQENIRGLGTIDKFDDMCIVGRRDRGITTIRDLRNRTIGLLRGTIADFYLGRFLELHGISLNEVNLVDVRPDLSSDALANSTIDGVVTWYPCLGDVIARYGANITVFEAQRDQETYWNAICREDWIASHEEIINRFLRSLVEAEQYSVTNRADAQQIVKMRLGYDNTYITMIWLDHQFSVSPDQSLISVMEDESRWMMANNLTDEKVMPAFSIYLNEDRLETIKPASVQIICFRKAA